MNATEINRLQSYMRSLFGSGGLEVRSRPNKDDSAEVYINGEFVGVLFKDEEDEELSYNFTMAILEFDLPEAGSA